jgi:hypothetical protein
MRNVPDIKYKLSQDTQFMFSDCFPKIVSFRDYAEKYSRAVLAT